MFWSRLLAVPRGSTRRRRSRSSIGTRTTASGTDGVYNLQRFVTCIARSGAHVVSLNEVEKFTGWGDEDQPARYAALLQAATGKTWYYTFAQRGWRHQRSGQPDSEHVPDRSDRATTLELLAVGRARANRGEWHPGEHLLDPPRRRSSTRRVSRWPS